MESKSDPSAIRTTDILVYLLVPQEKTTQHGKTRDHEVDNKSELFLL